MTSAVQVKSSNLAAGSTVKMFSPDVNSGVIVLSGMTAPDTAIPLTSARAATGAVITATAGSGIMGIARTPGTSLALVGEVTSASAKTNAATFFTALPPGYDIGTTVTLTANAEILGTGTLTAASTTLELAANSIVAGTEAALSVTGGAQQITAAASDKSWTIAGAGLTPGIQLAVTATMIVTSSSGANTGKLNSLTIKAT